ncbi:MULTISPECIES: hypothetical protein [Halomonadaceae]|uniref:Pimeloyl-[acyl-carrier protein] methyl ester esterase n=1 Tax=Vreelandella halophila TaxID=86177 RepID=A0A9X5B392_9GAMM|nr:MULTISPECIES: hypothetical protein [Halomonas]MYL25465.1 hypothetical protein [Halomonas utahensis]MYL74701.1 hypothetical protein [Halomonas sp. 22501_18_FS]
MTRAVVVGGWGIPAEALRPLLPAEVEPVLLEPARMAIGHQDLESALDAVMARVPSGVPWLGWSLGGQVAMAARERFPGTVSGVVTLCSTPRFLEGSDWSVGMADADFRGFREGMRVDVEQTLGRFCALVSQGSASPRQVRRELQALDWPELTLDYRQGLSDSLEWLARLDQRALWQQAGAWAQHLFCGRDALVSGAVPEALGLVGERCHLAAESCHWPASAAGATDWISGAMKQVAP